MTNERAQSNEFVSIYIFTELSTIIFFSGRPIHLPPPQSNSLSPNTTSWILKLNMKGYKTKETLVKYHPTYLEQMNAVLMRGLKLAIFG